MKQGEDERDRPIYDFGFGKDVLYAVDARKIPCKCGVGDAAESDETFNFFHSQIGPRRPAFIRPTDSQKASSKFWRKAKVFDWETFDPFHEDDRGDMVYQDPEVWCTCPIPRSAIIAKFDKNHPLSEG